MIFKLITGNWADLHETARGVRFDVFVIEQGVPVELEWDEWDPLCVHVVAQDEAGHAIGTGRLLPDGHIGRMAVIKSARGAGVGGAILSILLQEAIKRGDTLVCLNAQIHAEHFYARFGFTREGEEFSDAGIPHVYMRYGSLT